MGVVVDEEDVVIVGLELGTRVSNQKRKNGYRQTYIHFFQDLRNMEKLPVLYRALRGHKQRWASGGQVKCFEPMAHEVPSH